MTAVPEVGAPVSPAVVAALALAACVHLRELELPRPTVDQVLEATGATRSRAYELRDGLLAMLPSLQRPVGRPPAPPREIDPDTAYTLRGAVVTFVLDHPGCVYGGPDRRRYDDGFRRFVVELRDRYQGVDLEPFASAILVALGTLKEWLTPSAIPATTEPAEEGTSDEDNDDTVLGATPATPESAQIQTVVACWKTWSGGFLDFCDHVRHERRIPFGRSLLSQILHAHGVRHPARRRGRSPDELALRGAFKTFFGGAQWVGDGSPIAVTINGQRFCFNLELMVDAYSSGFVGMSVRDTEDSAAVNEAFRDGMATTGEAPLALLLDNRPSNHTPDVIADFSDITLRIRATQGRPQNKAHAEGGFGLFQQSIPALDLHGHDPRDLARQLLTLVSQTFARVINHRPRSNRRGRSRVDLYNESLTAEQIDQARAALEERCRKQQRARETAMARQDPLVRTLLDDTFTRLGLLDPEHHIRAAIARYCFDAVVEGIAIFEVKRRLATLPPDVDARYLLGIIRNLGQEREGIAIADELLRLRLDARDRWLASLVRSRDAARTDTPDLRARVLRFVDLALAADRGIDRSFWLLASTEEINTLDLADRAPLFASVARRIHTTHRVPYRERLDAVSAIAVKIAPLA
jgi:hypothetical protein